jgi:FemAB family
MELVHQCNKSGLRTLLIRGLGAERDRAEREVLEAGVPLPLSHRAIWSANPYPWEPWFLLVRGANGRACAGFGIEKVWSRTMPGYAILRMRRFGGKLPGEDCRAALEAVNNIARKGPRVLRLQINVFSRDGREEIGATLKDLGFREVRPPSVYRHTLIIDLKPSEDDIFASFCESARNKIRKTMRKSLRSVVISDPVYARRIRELQQEALQRTGGHMLSENWRNILKMSHENPNLSRVFGLFQGDDTAPENMEAFGWVCNHGDHGEYRAAGSTRRSDVNLPYGYLLAWDMIRWAKATGAEWFDMGGVTLADEDKATLEGISRFKRCFSREVAEVGAEWILEPSPVSARIADVVSNGAQRIRGWVGKLSVANLQAVSLR